MPSKKDSGSKERILNYLLANIGRVVESRDISTGKRRCIRMGASCSRTAQ